MPLLERTYLDLDLDFKKHPVTGDIVKKKDIFAIAGSLQNLFQTSNYERLFHPEFGCGMRQLLFEPIDSTTSTLIKDIILYAVQGYEPRVNVVDDDIVVEAKQDENGYSVSMTFYIVSDPEPITITLFLERLR